MAELLERRIEPSGWMRRWVSEFRLTWTSPGQAANLVQLPDGGAGLLFRETGDGAGDLSAIGPLRRARYKTTLSARFYLRACLHPGRARQALGLSLYELADQIAPLESIWGSPAQTLCGQLIGSEPGRAVLLMEEALRSFVERRKTEPAAVVSQIVRAIDDAPGTPTDQQARLSGLSPRQLRHLFRVELGISPKRYARIARIRALLASARTEDGWAELALAAGFHDQAHMIADFRDLLNSTPEAFLSGRSRRSR